MAATRATLEALCLPNKIICHLEMCKKEAESTNSARGYDELICSVMRYKLSGTSEYDGGFCYTNPSECGNPGNRATTYSEWKANVYSVDPPNPLFDNLINLGDNSINYQQYLDIYEKYRPVANRRCLVA